jgi:DNA-binding CsgD family transcriptional regulator
MPSNLAWPIHADSTETWLDPRVSAAIREQLPALADEVIHAIQREVPGYSRPLSGDFGRGIRSGTELALRRFIGAGGDESPAIYRSLGHGEHGAGRSLDALQSAYRVGARVAWQRMSEAADSAGASAETQRRLAAAMFAYIDQIAAESIEGYAEAQLAQAGELERRRATLFATLLGDPAPDAAALAAAAAEAQWPLPPTLACLVLGGGSVAATAARRLSGDTLNGRVGERTCIIVPNPTRLEHEVRAVAERLGIVVGLGPTVPVRHASLSMRWATLARELGAESARSLGAGSLGAAGATLLGAQGARLVVAERCLADIALLEVPDVVTALRERALAPLHGESERSRTRLEATLLSWLRHRGSQRAIAAELAVHPQTVRYRLRRLRDLFGATLEDPDRRFELEIALRDLRT